LTLSSAFLKTFKGSSPVFSGSVEAPVQDALGGAPLAFPHDRVDELGHQRAVVQRVRQELTLGNSRLRGIVSVACVILQAYDFGRLAPYFERPCLRPCTPTASSVPRTT
jgi:hypothetical protein